MKFQKEDCLVNRKIGTFASQKVHSEVAVFGQVVHSPNMLNMHLRNSMSKFLRIEVPPRTDKIIDKNVSWVKIHTPNWLMTLSYVPVLAK